MELIVMNIIISIFRKRNRETAQEVETFSNWYTSICIRANFLTRLRMSL